MIASPHLPRLYSPPPIVHRVLTSTIRQDLVVDSDTGDSSEDDLLAMKRRSLILMEQSLELPCDASPLAPRSMVQAETQPGNSGADIEKLLLERVMLRSVHFRIFYTYTLIFEVPWKYYTSELKIFLLTKIYLIQRKIFSTPYISIL